MAWPIKEEKSKNYDLHSVESKLVNLEKQLLAKFVDNFGNIFKIGVLRQFYVLVKYHETEG